MRLSILIILLFCHLGFSKSVYVSQTGAGSQNGTTAGNAYALTWLNTSGNWGGSAGTVLPGDTVHFVGYLTNNLVCYGSGTTGSNIILYFEPNSGFVAPTFSASSIIINVSGLTNIVIDGGSNPTNGNNGLIGCTDNGTLIANGGTCHFNHAGITAISDSLVTNLTIQNLTISNLYNRELNTEPVQGAGDSEGINGGGTAITIQNCLITGVQDSIGFSWSTNFYSNNFVYNCVLSNFNHGIGMSAGSGAPVPAPYFKTLIISNNSILFGDMFESVGGELGFHRNGIFFFNESSLYNSVISNVFICYNTIIAGNNPSPNSVAAGSGAMFFDGYTDTNYFHVRVYNNFVQVKYPLSFQGGGGLFNATGTDVLVANNTGIGVLTNGTWYGGGGGVGGSNAFFYNNILLDGAGPTLERQVDPYVPPMAGTTNPAVYLYRLTNYTTNIFSDYNVIVDGGAIGDIASIYFQMGTGITYSNWEAPFQALLDWQTYNENEYGDPANQYYCDCGWPTALPNWNSVHCDPHSVTNMPVFNVGSYVPATNDTVTAIATNLSQYFTDDINHNARPSSGAWTTGAFVSGYIPPPPTNNPTPLYFLYYVNDGF